MSQRNLIPTLNGWRGIAILLVLVDHFHVVSGPDRLQYIGQHGVGIFFVLSGFLITTKLIEEQDATGRIAFGTFYLHRFLRLAPTAICYLFTVRLLLASPADLRACLFFYRNYIEGHELTRHFWSLSLEEQFYLVWPPILFALRPRRALWIAICGSIAVGAWRLLKASTIIHAAFWVTVRTEYRVDALFIGCAIAILMRAAWARKTLTKFPVTIGLIALAGCMFHLGAIIPLWESVLIALVLGACSVLPPGNLTRRLLDSPLLSG